MLWRLWNDQSLVFRSIFVTMNKCCGLNELRVFIVKLGLAHVVWICWKVDCAQDVGCVFVQVLSYALLSWSHFNPTQVLRRHGRLWIEPSVVSNHFIYKLIMIVILPRISCSKVRILHGIPTTIVLISIVIMIIFHFPSERIIENIVVWPKLSCIMIVLVLPWTSKLWSRYIIHLRPI